MRTPTARRASIALLMFGALVTSACGTRVALEDIVAAEGGGSDTASGPRWSRGGGTAVGDVGATGSEDGGTATTIGGAVGGASGGGGTGSGTDGGAEAGADPGQSPDLQLSAACTSQGSPIRIGQIGTFSGVVGQAVGGSKTGMALWAADVNARGGLACHPVQLFQQDDQSDPAQAAAAVRDMVQNRGVELFVGSFVPLSITGYQQAVNDLGVITVGGDQTSFRGWNDDRLFYPIGAVTNATFWGAIHHAVSLGRSRVAVLTCVEAAVCGSIMKGYLIDRGGAASAGATVVYEAVVSLTQPDFTAACQNAKNAGADAIWAGVDGASQVRLANSCTRIGYQPLIVTQSIALGFDPNQPTLQRLGMAIGTAVFPWTANDTPGSRRFQDAARRHTPGTPTTGSMALAYASGLMLEAAVAHLGAAARDQDLTQDLVLQGLGMIENETLGGTIAPITFRPGQDRAPVQRCYFIAGFDETGWTAPIGSNYTCQPEDAPV